MSCFWATSASEGNQLTPDECRLLRGLVEFQASGLVFLPGIQGRQFSLLDTPLKDLYPVVLDDTQPSGWGSRTPSHFQLTELGERSLLTKLADSQQENAEVWDNAARLPVVCRRRSSQSGYRGAMCSQRCKQRLWPPAARW